MAGIERRTIEFELEPPIAWIRFNRPARLNALTKELMAEVSDVLDVVEGDNTLRAVILCGAGRAFSSGFDIAEGDEEATVTAADWQKHLSPAARFGQRLWSFPKVIIAAVHGYCLGGACGLAMLCDLTVASEECMFGEPEIRFGSASANVVLPWIVPIKIAKELLYTGKLITAQRAYEVGMVNEVVPRGDLERRARYYASLVAEISPAAVHTLKAAVNRSYELMGMQQALDFNFNLVAILAGSDTEEKRQFREMARSKGVKAALAWRAAQFAELEREW